MEGPRAHVALTRGRRQMPSTVIWPLTLPLHESPAVEICPWLSWLAGSPGVYDLSDYPRRVWPSLTRAGSATGAWPWRERQSYAGPSPAYRPRSIDAPRGMHGFLPTDHLIPHTPTEQCMQKFSRTPIKPLSRHGIPSRHGIKPLSKSPPTLCLKLPSNLYQTHISRYQTSLPQTRSKPSFDILM